MALKAAKALPSAARILRERFLSTLSRTALRGQIVLVTGDSSGLGYATAERLTLGGATVYGASRSAPLAPPRWRHLTMDVTDEAGVAATISGVVKAEGRLDAVVHFAGVSLSGPVEETTLAEAEQHFDVNYFGTVRVLRATLPVMRDQSHGRIVVIGSIAGLIGLGYLAHYGAAKAALDCLVEGVRAEIAPFGVEVGILHPGNYRTEIAFKGRRAAASGGGSPYATAFERAFAFFAANEAAGAAPADLARRVEGLLAARRLPPRIVAGQPIERLGVVGKRLLPARLFATLVRKVYGP